MDHQLQCFKQWMAIGYEIRSYNAEPEYTQLKQQGLDEKQLQKIDLEQTAKKLFNKQIPRILPILEDVLRANYDFYILTNSDIYPAHNRVVSSYFAEISESIAFTRAECSDLSRMMGLPQKYYRGGLDIFWFTKQGLQRVLKMLKETTVAERMTFGVPGWDFFLGHLMCKVQSSPIIDGSIFIHKSHKNTYSNFDEFDHYSTEMKKSGHYTAEGFVELAEEFHLFIVEKCAANIATAKTMEVTLYKAPTGGVL